jgi:hypothetical protein
MNRRRADARSASAHSGMPIATVDLFSALKSVLTAQRLTHRSLQMMI